MRTMFDYVTYLARSYRCASAMSNKRRQSELFGIAFDLLPWDDYVDFLAAVA